MYYATVMVLTTAATVLGVMVLRIHHQVSPHPNDFSSSNISQFSRNMPIQIYYLS